MNPTPTSFATQSPTLRDRATAWRTLLEECGEKPTRKRVHALRVVTLRVDAELEDELAQLPHASHQAQAMLRFGKVAEKLRTTLAPVREFDVWIDKLQRLRASLSRTSGYVPRSSLRCIRQIERLEARLKKKRRSAAQKLVAQITRRLSNFQSVADEIDDFASDRLPAADSQVVASILKQYQGIVADFPEFNEENLHDFRKRIKKVRYLAEIHQDADPACTTVAAQIRKVQIAIGEWHDWQALAQGLQHGRRARDNELREMLESLAAERLAHAIAECHDSNARMHELEARFVQASNGIRKPPQQGGRSLAPSQRKLA